MTPENTYWWDAIAVHPGCETSFFSWKWLCTLVKNLCNKVFVIVLPCGRVVLVDTRGGILVKNLCNALFVIMLSCGKVVLVNTWGCTLVKNLFNAVYVMMLPCGRVVLIDTWGCTLVKNLSNSAFVIILPLKKGCLGRHLRMHIGEKPL